MRKERKTIAASLLLQNNGQVGWLPKNPRQWTQTDIDRTVASITEDPDFLEDRPLLVTPFDGKYVVFAGNLRTEAIRRLKLAQVPVIVYTPEGDDDHYVIKRRAMKDNGSFGSWDYDELANSWDDMPLVDWGVPTWGADGAGQQEPGIEENTAKDDNFDPEREEIHVICKQGDIWQLGEHRLMCGDSITLEEVEKLVGGGA